ncbi:hypothetical protein BDV95DRAFT_138059 [Massariosphaeria phaeospora]|uniref:Uncharacterized protein n=1 Tax=Massariosphaeria phaeospora TaxID=100035 RepID=A0A7C8IP90_9PLEO|nr:hypothetical protein BDV95DRAFT_138059 [Massariosphaeria phaeospora]
MKSFSSSAAEEGLPPQYSVSSIPTKDLTPDQAFTQLQKYLLEIITYELDADFGSVNRAFSASESTSSILADDEKQELFRLSSIIKNLHQSHLTNRWLLTLNSDRDDIFNAVIEPALLLSTAGSTNVRVSMRSCTPFLLDLISTYAEHRCDPKKRQHTLLSQYNHVTIGGIWAGRLTCGSVWARRFHTILV